MLPVNVLGLVADALDGPEWPARVQAAVSVLTAAVKHNWTCPRCYFDADVATAAQVLSGRFDATLVDLADAVVELANELQIVDRRCLRG